MVDRLNNRAKVSKFINNAPLSRESSGRKGSFQEIAALDS
jgi:hypothetical protein